MSKKIIMFMPSIEGGGVEKNFIIVANHLSKSKKISVITVSKKFRKKFNKKIKFISLKSDYWDKLSRRVKYIIALTLLIKEFFVEKEKIVFCFQANIYAIIVSKLFSVKIIVRSNSAPIGWSKNFIKRIIFKHILSFADKIMVNSNDFKRDLKKEFNVNSVCIYNPLDSKEILKKSKKNIYNIFDNNSLRIINIGRFTDQKDQITFLKAVNEIKNKIKFQAIIMGRGILEMQLKKFIKSNNLNKFVKIIGFKKNPYPYMHQAEIFVLSSAYEGLPNVLLEALVLNKFVISSDCRTGPREILLNGKGGDLFKVGDYKNLSKLILNYKINKKKSLKKINLSKKNLIRFDYNINLKKYSKLVESIN